ncbi:class F sortase [Paenisporosarcina cavernae]|uniref:Class F sortase n=2 Tax=Paenisporosarcina cavernae TaxID=2320858 RepID=A0A385YWC7_9BACL|nr:class F sortase [Paenisporosarcina cavernae]
MPSASQEENGAKKAPIESAETAPITLAIGNETLSSDKIIQDDRQGITPSNLTIPAINVDAPVEGYGVNKKGEMDVPNSVITTGWYDKGYMPGAAGNAVIAGHVDGKKGPAVFYDLKELQNGDEIIVSDEQGNEKIFVVDRVKSYPVDEAPLDEIFGFKYGSSLNLITCTGDYSNGGYEERLVVYSNLKE